jgi:hypothetical protein
MDFRLEYEASDELRGRIRGMGRTEDVAFSPDNRRLALARFASAQIAIFDICIEPGSDPVKISILDYWILASPRLKCPHGVSFMDNDTLIVASREGYVDVFSLPATGLGGRTINLMPRHTLKGNWFSRLRSPGSVGVYATEPGRFNILVCNNYAHVVTSHVLETTIRSGAHHQGVLLQKGLSIPDGICVSASHKWIAVSNHGTGTVLIYANTPMTNRRSEPAGVCRGIDCPHGLRFVGDDRYLLVAAAAAPYVHVFERGDGDWAGARDPAKTVRVLDEATFLRGRSSAEEGGPKGIDVDRTMRVLVATCEQQVLSFFDLQKMILSG